MDGNYAAYTEAANSADVVPDVQHCFQQASASQSASLHQAEQSTQPQCNIVCATVKKKPRPWRGLSKHLEETSMAQQHHQDDSAAASITHNLQGVANQNAADEDDRVSEISQDIEWDLSVLDLIVEQGLGVLERPDIKMRLAPNPTMPQVSVSVGSDPITIDIPASDVQ
jgi:hypothetical protein